MRQQHPPKCSQDDSQRSFTLPHSARRVQGAGPGPPRFSPPRERRFVEPCQCTGQLRAGWRRSVAPTSRRAHTGCPEQLRGMGRMAGDSLRRVGRVDSPSTGSEGEPDMLRAFAVGLIAIGSGSGVKDLAADVSTMFRLGLADDRLIGAGMWVLGTF